VTWALVQAGSVLARAPGLRELLYTPPSSGGVPAADVVFLPSLPATVVAVKGATGEQPGRPFLELAARGALALTGELPPTRAR